MSIDEKQKVIIEAYIGEYASGKSENAVNRAIALAEMGRRVSIIDLDLVEPFYTLRPLKQLMAEKGVEIVAWDTKDAPGLGEAGAIITPPMRWALKREGDVILDIGYGVEGAKIMKLLYGSENNPNLKIIVVINARRPMTSTVDDIVNYLASLGRVDGIINNTHLGSETTLDTIKEGIKLVGEAADKADISIIATTADIMWEEHFGKDDGAGHEMRYLHRFMENAIW